MPKYKDLNDFAKVVTIAEKGKKQISIAQVKEVISKINEKLAPEIDLYALIKAGKMPVAAPDPKSEQSFCLTIGQAGTIRASIAAFNTSRKGTQDGIALVERIEHVIGKS